MRTAVLLTLALLAASPVTSPLVADAYLPSPPPVDLLPMPKTVTWGVGSFVLAPSTRIVVGEQAKEEDLYAAHALNEELQARFGTPLEIVRARPDRSSIGQIVLGEPTASSAIRGLLQAGGLTVSVGSPGPEGYILRVTPQGVLVAGSERRGTFYGVQTLRQLLRPDGSGIAIPAVTIRDWPDHAIRAVHVLLDGMSADYLERLIDRVLAPYKFNTLVAEAEYVQWESGRPFWAPDPRGATKAQVRRLLNAARHHHIQVIPLIETLGHSEWVFAGLRDESLCRELAYIPRRLQEEGKTQVTCNRARGVYPSVYDPTRPVRIDGRLATLDDALIFPVLKEAVALFSPQFVHLGHDEVRGPEGVRYDLDLYFRDIVALDQLLKGLGVHTMVWGDVLWDRRDEMQGAPAYRSLPRDITIVPWKYEGVREYPEVAYFRKAGFPVIGTTWFNPDNNFYFSQAAKEAGARGMIRATWTGQFFTAAALTRAYQQLYTYFIAAAYFWTAGRPQPADAPPDTALARRFADAWMPTSYRQQPIAGTLGDLSESLTQQHIDEDGTGWLGKGPDYDLSALTPGRHRLAGVVFDMLDPKTHAGKSIVMLQGEREIAASLPARVRIPWQGQSGCLMFLHATLDRADGFGERVGQYTMTLAGGQQVSVDLLYGKNISSWLADLETGIPSIEQEIAWAGTTHAGNAVNLQLLRWANPTPGQPVESIEVTSAGRRASPVVFAITGLERCP